MSGDVEFAVRAVRRQAESEAVARLMAEIRARLIVNFDESCTEHYRKGFDDCHKRVETVLGEWERMK